MHSSGKEENQHSTCCGKGRLSGLLQHFNPAPEPLKSLLLDEGGPDAEAKAAKAQIFANWLLRIGEGTEPIYPQVGEDYIRLPPEMRIPGDTLEDLIDEVYGDLAAKSDFRALADYITSRAILAP